MRVLIVDDAVFIRKILRDILIEGGHEVVGEASNGFEAFSKYSLLIPDIVTMDITMPLLDGIDSTKKILSKYSNAKIIMCSAMGQKSQVLEAIRIGAVDFIVKPFQKVRVLTAVENQNVR